MRKAWDSSAHRGDRVVRTLGEPTRDFLCDSLENDCKSHNNDNEPNDNESKSIDHNEQNSTMMMNPMITNIQ